MRPFRYSLQNRGLCSELNSVLGIYQKCRELGTYSFIYGAESLYFQKILFWQVFKPHEFLKTFPPPNSQLYKSSRAFNVKEARTYARTTYKQSMSNLDASQALVFQNNFEKSLLELIKSVKLPKIFNTIHIRWGDKVGDAWDRETILRGSTEAKKKFFADYFKPLKNIPIGTIFIMTDDITSIDLAKDFLKSQNLPHKIKFLTRPEQKGRSESQDLDAKKQYSRQELLQFFAEIEIAKRSKFFVGTRTSNVYRYIKNTCKSKTKFISID